MKRIDGADWQRLFKVLLDDAEPTGTNKKVADLERALVLRGQKLESTPMGDVERKAFEDAIVVLIRIKRLCSRELSHQIRELIHSSTSTAR
jgi:hypothetical protein